jgi:hypothetical protein
VNISFYIFFIKKNFIPFLLNSQMHQSSVVFYACVIQNQKHEKHKTTDDLCKRKLKVKS